ncbi:hypothetical protein M405DRAFT_937214 [Rhizopogon salebrosus TDB-379]|nr:hypothetical protein M405DRAFT_937214 [Rhizopogon salebrosus TDB-379]
MGHTTHLPYSALSCRAVLWFAAGHSPSPRHFTCMLLDSRSELVTRRNASRATRAELLMYCSFAYAFKTLGDTKGVYPQALITFQPGMRGTRKKLQWLMHVTMFAAATQLLYCSTFDSYSLPSLISRGRRVRQTLE